MAESNSSGRRETTLMCRFGPWKQFWRRLWNPPWPCLGCEISQTGVSAARWSWNTGRLEAASWKPVPDGAIEASPLRENIRNPEPVREALGAGLESIGISPGHD